MKQQYLFDMPHFTVENIGALEISRPKGYKHSYRDGRFQNGFIYTVHGKMCYSFANGKTVYVGAGELIFIPKSCVYTGVYQEDNTEIKIVQFDLASGTLSEYLTRPLKLTLPRAEELFSAFFEPPVNEKGTHPFYNLSCMYRLLWQVDEAVTGIPPRFKRLRPAILEINAHFDRNVPVSYYAALCDMSEVNFRRLFREYTGMPPIEYRNTVRLNNAVSKLQSGDYNVSETAAACGFSNLSFFTRQYKKKFGHTPKEE